MPDAILEVLTPIVSPEMAPIHDSQGLATHLQERQAYFLSTLRSASRFAERFTGLEKISEKEDGSLKKEFTAIPADQDQRSTILHTVQDQCEYAAYAAGVG